MTHDGWSAGILRCNVPTVSASSVAARDVRRVGQPPSVGGDRVSPGKRTACSRSAWVGDAFASPIPSAVDSPEKRTLLDVRLSLIHISEPTRLGMISYAVLCLKK